MFGDVGEGIINEDGLSYIWLDPVFAQTISTSQYQVFLQKYTAEDIFVKERNVNYFIVKGTPGSSFGWEIKGKQKEYDQVRMEISGNGFSVPSSDGYVIQAAEYIENLREGRIV